MREEEKEFPGLQWREIPEYSPVSGTADHSPDWDRSESSRKDLFRRWNCMPSKTEHCDQFRYMAKSLVDLVVKFTENKA